MFRLFNYGNLVQDSGFAVEEPQSAPVRGQRYQWQLSDRQVWRPIENDHVIETHYCQPGATGITLFTSNFGRIFIDFDKMEVCGAQLDVRRQTFLAHDEKQEFGWYYNDNRRWYEYGSQGSSSSKASVTSSDVEQQYSTTPQGSMQFRVGHMSYSISFTAMTQRNLTTSMSRRVRRRPKFNSILKINSPAVPPLLQNAAPIGGGWKWQFMADEGVWTNYISPDCSVDSDEIERRYQRNPQDQVKFTSSIFSYTLDFTGMFQTNDHTGTKRSVRRIPADGQPTPLSLPRFVFPSLIRPSTAPPTLSLPPPDGCTWEFMADEGVWTEYQTPNSSVGSVEIERAYQLNPQGQIKFTASGFSYTLDFTGMYQVNDIFGTKRAVRRIQMGNPQQNSWSSAGTQHRWQFKDVNGVWKDYVQSDQQGGCNVSGQDIESQFQQNPNGTMRFSTASFIYELDFSAMTQRNLFTETTREVRRL
ncbi:hypothetical protein MATL_G00249490 [Megalops atlanticus]|uniref:WWE domain-containing protein n=1 Tax=Megalops atlanticus TaxID=7932 RepID=A0A9D3PFP8_MEGAT|nr:hypothetical protein MATL_G00249490 [Megalops atlanticus]